MSTEFIAPNDPRDDWQKLSRGDVRQCLEKLGMDLKPTMSHNDAIEMLKMSGVNVRELVDFEPVPVKQENGVETIQHYPKRINPVYTEAEVQRRETEFEKRLQEAEKGFSGEKRDLEAENQKLQDQIANLTKIVEDMNQDLLKYAMKKRKERPKETDPLKMKWMAQKKWLKEHGVELNKGDDAVELVKQVLAKEQDNDDTVTGG